jgi:hypothetical protein
MQQQAQLCLTSTYVECPRLAEGGAPAVDAPPHGRLVDALAAGEIPSPTFETEVSSPTADDELPASVGPEPPAAPPRRPTDRPAPANGRASRPPPPPRLARLERFVQAARAADPDDAAWDGAEDDDEPERRGLPRQLAESWHLVTTQHRLPALLLALAILVTVIGLIIAAITVDRPAEPDQTTPDLPQSAPSPAASSPSLLVSLA